MSDTSDRQQAFLAALREDLTVSIKALQGAMRVAGCYPKGEDDSSDGDPGKGTFAAFREAKARYAGVGKAMEANPPKLKPEIAPASSRGLKHPPMAHTPVQLISAGPLNISREGALYIIEEETGGQAYWERHYSRPYWPEGMSGVTIGVGFDLGYYSSHEVRDAWGHLGSVDEWELAALREAVGIRGPGAKSVASKLAANNVQITWEDALAVFYEYTLPQFGARAARALPGVERLHPHVSAILVSMIYNRGESMKPISRYREKIAIRDLIAGAAAEVAANPVGRAACLLYHAIAANLAGMARLWPERSQNHGRRQREAAGVRSIALSLGTIS